MNYAKAIFWLLLIVLVIVGLVNLYEINHDNATHYEKCTRLYSEDQC